MNQFKFITTLYEEHLTELSFLYSQRIYLMNQNQKEFFWIDYEKIENRIEPHLDALNIGGEIALEVCQKQSIEGDFGELYAACCIFCRQKRLDLICDVIEKIDSDDKDRIIAITDALKYEMPGSWEDYIKSLLASKDQVICSIAAKICGFRRINAEKELIQYLSQHNPHPVFIWALGRMPGRKTFSSEITSILFPYINHKNEKIQYESLISLLRSGVDCVSAFVESDKFTNNLPLIPAALSFNPQCIASLTELAAQKKASSDCLVALGLIGNKTALNILIEYLSEEHLAEIAAISLYLITGADLFEEVFIPEAIDEELLFEDELEKIKNGEPLYPSGKEPGTTELRLSKKPEKWKNWLKENNKRFLPEEFYRLGKPNSPVCLLETIQSKHSSQLIRQLAYDELVIRFDKDITFETEMFVKQQNDAIHELKGIICCER